MQLLAPPARLSAMGSDASTRCSGSSRAQQLAALFLVLLALAPSRACLTEPELRDLVDESLQHLEALAARRVRPDGSGGGEGPNPLPAYLFPNSTDPETGEYLGFENSKWTSGGAPAALRRGGPAWPMRGCHGWAGQRTAAWGKDKTTSDVGGKPCL